MTKTMLTESPSHHFTPSQQQMHSLLMQTPVAIAIYRGPSMIVELINDKCLELWNKTMNEVLNHPLFDVFPEAKEKGFEIIFATVYETGRPYSVKELTAEVTRYGKKETVWFNAVYGPLRNDSGVITGIITVATEVTEQVLARKKIEESEKNFRIAIEQSPTAIAIIKIPEFVIELANKKWLENMRAELEELYGKSIFDIFPALEEKGLDKILKAMITSGQPHYEPEHRVDLSRFGGSGVVYFNVVYQPLTDANGITNRIMIISHEITELVEVRKKIEESESHFRQLADKMKELEQRKDDFIRMANHELRTPVTSIKGYVQLLLTALKKEEAEEKKVQPLLIKSSLVSIDKQITRLTRLMSELLDLSKIETGTFVLNKELFNLNELVIETVQDILYTNSKHSINIFHDFGCDVHSDKDRIGQVLINFLTNAIKYSPNSDRIEVWIRQSEKNTVSVSIRDSGIGIDKKYHEKIFERFYRAEGKEEQTYPGFGIGLFIAKEIIERHNGSIQLTSDKGKGSVFTFILSVAP
jgi:PAS domain S-box-containing protein